jgi:hypothetical protein
MDIITPQAARPAMTPPLWPTHDVKMKRLIFPYVDARFQSVRPAPYELQKASRGATAQAERTRYHLSCGKIIGTVALDIAARPT